MEITFMLLSRGALALFACAVTGCAAQSADTASVCPTRSVPAKFVDVFDGAPSELATLIPDVDGENTGHWLLGYVYDAGRVVTVRCKYADRVAVDVPLRERVTRCDYKTSASKELVLTCR